MFKNGVLFQLLTLHPYFKIICTGNLGVFIKKENEAVFTCMSKIILFLFINPIVVILKICRKHALTCM